MFEFLYNLLPSFLIPSSPVDLSKGFPEVDTKQEDDEVSIITIDSYDDEMDQETPKLAITTKEVNLVKLPVPLVNDYSIPKNHRPVENRVPAENRVPVENRVTNENRVPVEDRVTNENRVPVENCVTDEKVGWGTNFKTTTELQRERNQRKKERLRRIRAKLREMKALDKQHQHRQLQQRPTNGCKRLGRINQPRPRI